MIGRGKGHAVVHEMHDHGSREPTTTPITDPNCLRSRSDSRSGRSAMRYPVSRYSDGRRSLTGKSATGSTIRACDCMSNGVICWPSGWPPSCSSPSAARPSTAAPPTRPTTPPRRESTSRVAGGRPGGLRGRGREDPRHADDRHRLAGVRPVVLQERPDQRRGLRVRRRLRRRGEARLHRRPGAVDQGAVQLVVRTRSARSSTSTSTRSRSRPNAPRSSTSPTATTRPRRP